MWQFDEKDYLTRVLGSAVQTFANEGRLPDLFERYALPLDISDPSEINKALDTVTNFWNKRRQNSRDKQLLSVLVGKKEQTEARRVLLDDAARGALRTVVDSERRRRSEQRWKRLDESIALVAGKGHLTPAELAVLEARFGPEGISPKEITARIRVPVRETSSKLPTNEGLPQTVRNQIRSNLAVVQKKDLYDFLGVARGAAPKQLAERYRIVEAEWRPRPADFLKTAANDLLGIVKVHLIDGDTARYEAALHWDIVEKLRQELQLPAADKVIDRNEFRALLTFATSLGLTEQLATDYIIALAQDPKVGASVEWTTAGDSIRCMQCAALMPRRSGTSCSVCGSGLWVDCPRCKQNVPISDSACSGCGFVIADWPYVKLLMRKAELYLEDRLITDALTAAREAEQRWGRKGVLAPLLDKIEAARRTTSELVEKLRAAVDGHHLAAAQKILGALAGSDPELRLPDQRSLAEVAQDIEGALLRAAAQVKQAREFERAGQLEEAVFASLDALAIDADAVEAQQLLRRSPPAPPSEVRATLRDGQVLLQWAPTTAAGAVTYVVIRSEGSPPASRQDGTIVEETRETTSRSAVGTLGPLLYYGVAVQRGGADSAVATAAGVLVAREVEGAVLKVGDGVVTGIWQAPLRGRVRVLRKEDRADGSISTETEITLTGPTTFIDRQIKNGQTYHYRLVTELHVPSGRGLQTDGVTLVARPDATPSATEDLEVAMEEDGLRISWTAAPKGEVCVYRCTAAPPWTTGTVVPISELAALGSPLSRLSVDSALDPTPLPGLSIYLPVTIAGERAVIGSGHRYVSIVDVRDLVVQDFDSYALLRWSWPERCSQVLLAWRPDGYPHAADDTRATSRRITRAEYDRHGGFQLEHPAAVPHHFVVYAMDQVDGKPAFAIGKSPGARAMMRSRSHAVVSYSIKRQWLRRRRLTIELRADSVVEFLPFLVVVAKSGELQPIHAADGVVVLELSGLRVAPNAPISHQIVLPELRTPVYLRAFFSKSPAGGRVRLVDPPHEQLKIQ